MNDWKTNLYANPHSQSPSSTQTTHQIEAVRKQVLDFFNVANDDYEIVFTYNATAALKLVGECFPWSKESEYRYLYQAHNSLVGIREYVFKLTRSC